MRKLFVFLLMLWMGVDVFAANGPLSGSGTKIDPWLVEDYEDLKMVGKENYTLEGVYLLTADIDASASANEYCSPEGSPCNGFVPIGMDTVAFSGTFNGAHHTIKNLFIWFPCEDQVGLFSNVDGGTINKLTLENISVVGDYYVGALVGKMYDGVISNVKINGVVTGAKYVGGLMGIGNATINYSSVEGIVKGTTIVGGLVGYASGSLYNVSSNVSVMGEEDQIGGLVGELVGEVTHSYSLGPVITKDDNAEDIGGLIGLNSSKGTVSHSYSMSSVICDDCNDSYGMGGLVGDNNGSIDNSYSTGGVKGVHAVGGFVGVNHGSLLNVYSTGRVYGESDFGGLVGYNENGTATASYWNKELSGSDTSAFGVGLTSIEMRDSIYFENWDFSFIWSIVQGSSFPYLNSMKNVGIAFPTANTVWTEEPIVNGRYPDPTVIYVGRWVNSATVNEVKDSIYYNYQLGTVVGSDTIWGGVSYMAVPNGIEISSYADLKKIGEEPSHPLCAKYFLMADIDAVSSSSENCMNGTCAGFNPIGDSLHLFSGSFEGNNHTIQNLFIYRPKEDYVGLFADVEGGVIQNLSIKNSTVMGWNYVGALAGYVNDYTLVLNSYSIAGEVKGFYGVGGLIGGFYKSLANKVFTTGSVKGSEIVGGLVGGSVNGLIQQSYSISSVTGTNAVGGLFGYNDNTKVKHAYSVGAVRGNENVGGLAGSTWLGLSDVSVESCYWDLETSGISGDQGVSTVAMLTQETFVGWAFDTVWTMVENSTYPYFIESTYIPVPETSIPVLDSTEVVLGGLGIKEAPYLISSYPELKMIGRKDYSLDAYYVLTANIEASASVKENCDSTGFCAGFLPIGLGNAAFSGSFNGNKKTISNLVINRPSLDSVGLFSVINSNASIYNLGFKTSYITGNNYVGGLVGINNGGHLDNVNVNVFTSGNDYVGGLVGKNYGTILIAHSADSVKGNNYVGGLIGENGGGQVSNAYSLATVKGNDYIGGFVGLLANGSIANVYSAGSVEAISHQGGLIGDSIQGSITSSYWDYEVSGVDSSAGGVGYTSHGMTKAANFVNWDFATIWNIVADSTYPYFSWSQQIVYPVLVDSSKLILSGTGTAKDPFLIENYEDLKVVGFGPYSLSSHFRVVADIDASASAREKCNTKGVCSGFLPIGIDSSIRFSGTFDGGGFEIKNLLINNISSIYAGLFWTIDTIGVVDSLGIRNLALTGSTVGSIAGLNLGTISNSYATDSVIGNAYSGGLVGINKGDIFNSSFEGKITGYSYIGGLVGENSGHVLKSSANASVEATQSYAGGLMGLNTGILSNSFATGSVDGSAYSGGLVGDNRGSIDSSYATASVIGSSFIGGLLGSNTSTVTNAYASGIVTGSTNVGGLIGKNTGAVDSSYAVGSVVGSSTYIGGLIGVSDSSVTNSYAEGSVTGGSYVGGLIGENDGSVKFSHAIGSVIGTGDKVGGLIGRNNDTIFNNYAIGNVSAEENVGGLVGDNTGFIKNSYAKGDISKGYLLGGFVGLNSGVVNNCYATGNISGNSPSSANIGGFIGINMGSVSYSFSTGSALGVNIVGGFIGHNGSVVINSYSTGSVKGTYTTGGFVSVNVGTIINSYSTGDVLGVDNVGSFVGSQPGTQYEVPNISNSYSFGRVIDVKNVNGFIGYNKNSTITSSYWNIDLYPSDTTYLAKGLTTTEMLQQSSYANWNFDTDWNMVSDSTYPYLRGMQNAAFALNDSLNFTISIPSTDSLVEVLLKNDYMPEITDAKLIVRFDSTSEILLSTLNRDTLTIGDTFTLYYQVGYISALDTLWGSHASAIISLKPEEPRVGSSMDVLFASDLHIHLSNQTAEVRYVIPSAGAVNLFLFDLQGHRVQSFVFGNQSFGVHFTTVDLSILPGGRYFAVLTLNGRVLQNLSLMLNLRLL